MANLEGKIQSLKSQCAAGIIDSDDCERGIKIATLREGVINGSLTLAKCEEEVNIILSQAGFKNPVVRKATPAPSSPTMIIQTLAMRKAAADIATAAFRASVPVQHVEASTFVDPTPVKGSRKGSTSKGSKNDSKDSSNDESVNIVAKPAVVIAGNLAHVNGLAAMNSTFKGSVVPKKVNDTTIAIDNEVAIIRERIKNGEITLAEGRKLFESAKKIRVQAAVVDSPAIPDYVPEQEVFFTVQYSTGESSVMSFQDVTNNQAVLRACDMLREGASFSKVTFRDGVVIALNKTHKKCAKCEGGCIDCNYTGKREFVHTVRTFCESAEKAHETVLKAIATDDMVKSGSVSDEIRRADLLVESRAPSMQPVIPSRKAGAIQAKKPPPSNTRMQKSFHSYVATFSHG
jgi:hypothetical protein